VQAYPQHRERSSVEAFETVASAISSILASPIETHELPAVAEVVRLRSAARCLAEHIDAGLPERETKMLGRAIGRHASHARWPWAVLRAIEEEMQHPELTDVPPMTVVQALRTLARYKYAQCPACCRPVPPEPLLDHWANAHRWATEDAESRAGAAPLAGVA